MKSLTFKELDLIVAKANAFSGYVVQEVIFSNNVLVLYMRKGHKDGYLICDVGAQKPVFLVSQESLPVFKKETKPLVLFLRAHLIGKSLLKANRKAEYGRFVELRFENAKQEWLEMELHLFAQAKNIIAKTQSSLISLNKTKPVPEVTDMSEGDLSRTPSEVYSDWLIQKKSSKTTVADDPKKNFEKVLAKKQQGLEDLKNKLKSMNDGALKIVGDWLRENRTLDGVPAEYLKWVDLKKSLQDNIENIFEKIKQNKKKSESVIKRIEELEHEIARLNPENAVPKVRKAAPSPLADAKGRTKNFSSGVSAYIGKSAADNLKILRKAKAWYWWVHPKDLPGSHAVIALDKGAPLESEVLKKVALWTLQESLTPKQWKDWQGVKCQFIYCECRFVTPIKGDKLGRVHYKNEKILTLTVHAAD